MGKTSGIMAEKEMLCSKILFFVSAAQFLTCLSPLSGLRKVHRLQDENPHSAVLTHFLTHDEKTFLAGADHTVQICRLTY